jgi:hypothetical protein
MATIAICREIYKLASVFIPNASNQTVHELCCMKLHEVTYFHSRSYHLDVATRLQVPVVCYNVIFNDRIEQDKKM